MRAFAARAGPWLFPIVVMLPIILWFVRAERLKNESMAGKLNRVHLGMDRELAEEILGPTRYTVQRFVKAWDFDDCMIVIEFDELNQVCGKRLQRLYPGPS